MKLISLRFLAIAGLLGVGPSTQAATLSIEKNSGGSYDVVLTLAPADGTVYATDVFISMAHGATISAIDQGANPFDVAVGNLKPAGKTATILIGGSNIQGSCEGAPAQRCFDDASCGPSGPCVMGQRGPKLALGSLDWDGKGALILDDSSSALRLSAGAQDSIPLEAGGGCKSPKGETILAGADTDNNGTIDACEKAKPAARAP